MLMVVFVKKMEENLEQSVKLPIQIGNYGYVVNIEIKNGEPATVVRKVKVCTYCIDSFNLITKFKLNDNLYELVSDYVYKTREEAEQALKGGE